MSNISNYRLVLDPDSLSIKHWFELWEQKYWFEQFMFLWMSFNALYDSTTVAERDTDSWNEFIQKKEVLDVWDSCKDSDEMKVFLDFLKTREVYDKFGMRVNAWWLYNLKNNTLFKEWNYWLSLKKYISTIYRIRNNFFHGWKRWDRSDLELITKASISFSFFLKKLYGFDSH